MQFKEQQQALHILNQYILLRKKSIWQKTTECRLYSPPTLHLRVRWHLTRRMCEGGARVGVIVFFRRQESNRKRYINKP